MPTESSFFASNARRLTRDQIALIEEAHPGRVAWEEGPADSPYLYDPERLLVRSEYVDRVRDILAGSGLFQSGGGPEEPDQDQPEWLARRYVLPDRLLAPDAERRRPHPKEREISRVLLALDLLDEVLPAGAASPDHWLHVAPVGSGKICPAIEPQETGLEEPWPPCAVEASRGQGVRVSVVDTGWNPDSETYPATTWLLGVRGDDEGNGAQLRPYAGHGTFIAGVVRCVAPATEVRVRGFLVGGGAILESEMVRQLVKTLAGPDAPQIINLSAGACTRRDRPLLSFELFWEEHLSKQTDCILVAAAGNDGSPTPFWPAAFDWALGVGSLDRDGRVSDFSNYHTSADVYALGRNLINTFPLGSYTCHEPPDQGDERVFDNGLARWSGTSFSAPVVVGLIAAEMSASSCDAATARDAVLARATAMSDPAVGPIQALLPPYA